MNVVQMTQPTTEPSEITFEVFYALYVRHEARKDAMKAWNTLSEADQLAAIEGALVWRRSYLSRERCMVPLPATFLRGERWADELPSTPTSISSSHRVFDAAKPPTPRGILPDAVRAELRRLTGRS